MKVNIQEYQLNYSFLGSLSLGGILPIIYTLTFLQISGKRSWYPFILSVLTVALSLATLFRTLYVKPNTEMLLSGDHSIPGCGRRDPSTFCGSRFSMTFSVTDMDPIDDASVGPTLVISLLVLCLLFLDQVRFHRLPAIQKFLTSHLRSITQPDHTGLSDSMKARRILFYTLLWIVYVTFWILYVFLFAKYFYLLWDNRQVVPTRWAFGQIVAITVWVPVLFEYGYLEACESLSQVCGGVTRLLSHKIILTLGRLLTFALKLV